MVDEKVDEKIDVNPDTFDAFLTNVSLSNSPSSLLSFISSMTAKQGKLLNYIFTSELMSLENAYRGDMETPIIDIYNSIWLMINLNMFFKDAAREYMNQYTENIARTAQQGIKFATIDNVMPFAQQQQVIALVNESSMKYLTKFGDELSKSLSTILQDGLAKGATKGEMLNKMKQVYQTENWKLERIIRTETMRAANTAAYAQALSEGAEYYSIDGRAEFCSLCRSIAKRGPYPISDKNHIPPLHPNCACIPIFTKDKSTAENDQEFINRSIDKQRAILEKEGFTIPEDGTGKQVNKKKIEERIQN